MTILQIRFVSGNKFKIDEAQTILRLANVSVIPVSMQLTELQTEDPKRLINEKALQAFRKIGRPLFVEHTGLYIKHLNEFPGGLTQIFWDRLQADRFCELFGTMTDTSVIAKTVIGYIDGKKIHYFEGEIPGSIAPKPVGDRAFQWDCVFIPTGYSKTFSEMGVQKNEISMRRKALDNMAEFLKQQGVV